MTPAKPSPRLILASGSSYKQKLLTRLGLPFESADAEVDESPLRDEVPQEHAARLARRKARTIASQFPGAFVIGADQVVALGHRRFSKPVTVEATREQLLELNGKTHDLFTAVAVINPHGALVETSVHYLMEMRLLTADEIAAYVAEDNPVDCAGGYKIECAGIRLFRAMRGDDYTAIIGLPLTRVWHLLEQADYFDPQAP